MRVLFWKEDKKRPAFSGKKFELFRVRWDKKTRKTVKTGNAKQWGLEHPVDGRIIMLRRKLEHYGRVMETPDISVSAVLGKPTMEVLGKPIPEEIERENHNDT